MIILVDIYENNISPYSIVIIVIANCRLFATTTCVMGSLAVAVNIFHSGFVFYFQQVVHTTRTHLEQDGKFHFHLVEIITNHSRQLE